MAETANEPASLLSDIARILGKGSKRGPAHRSTSMHFASGVLCFQTHKNPAVQRCCNLRNGILCEPFTPEDRQQFDEDFLRLYDLFMQEIDEDAADYKNANTAALAYRTAMPEPTSRRSVKAFIACVLHAMSIDILDIDEGSKLLSGARTATMALSKRAPSKDKKEGPEAVQELPANSSASHPEEQAISVQ
jgi:hypothetical protein